MWISKKKYEELQDENKEYQNLIDKYIFAWDAEYRKLYSKINELSDSYDRHAKAYGHLADKRFDMVLAQQAEIEKLTETLNNVINITFEDNKGFETVVFQRYGQAPIIYHKGKKLEVDDNTEVDITMIDGISVIETTETHA